MLQWLTAVMLFAGVARAAMVVTVSPYVDALVVGYPCAFRVTIHNTGASDVAISGGGGQWSASVAPATQGSANTSSSSLPDHVPAGGDVVTEGTFYPTSAGPVTITVAIYAIAGSPTGFFTRSIASTNDAAAGGHVGTDGMEVRHNIVHLRYGSSSGMTGFDAPALVVLHGTPGGKVKLDIAGPTGRPLGEINRTFYVIGQESGSTVTLDANGNGVCNIAGSANGTGLGTGLYWVMASGAVVARKPLLVVSYK